jgi:hypothetical protein
LHDWLKQVQLPLAAYKVWQTVFIYSYQERRWSTRPWLGVEHDPLRLP